MHSASIQNYDGLFSKLSLIKRDYGINDKVVFINSNELGLKKAAEVLKSVEFPEKGCHMGVSCWQNFDIAVQTKPEFIITFDYNNLSVNFMLKSVELLRKCASRQEFISDMAKHLSIRSPRVDKGSWDSPLFRLQFRDDEDKSKIFIYPEKKGDEICNADPFHQMCIKEYGKMSSVWELAIKEEAQRAESWLSCEENYEYVRKLALQKRTVHLCLNICETTAFEEVQIILKECAVRVNTLYLSNIYDYFSSWSRLKQESQSFRRNVKKIIDPETVIIEACCTPSKGFIEDLKQNIVKGKDPVSGNVYTPDHLRGLKSKTETDKEYDEKHRKEHYPGALLLSPRS